jgi:hypothetical protein
MKNLTRYFITICLILCLSLVIGCDYVKTAYTSLRYFSTVYNIALSILQRDDVNFSRKEQVLHALHKYYAIYQVACDAFEHFKINKDTKSKKELDLAIHEIEKIVAEYDLEKPVSTSVASDVEGKEITLEDIKNLSKLISLPPNKVGEYDNR